MEIDQEIVGLVIKTTGGVLVVMVSSMGVMGKLIVMAVVKHIGTIHEKVNDHGEKLIMIEFRQKHQENEIASIKSKLERFK